MAIDAVIHGVGLIGFLFLYAAFKISNARFVEKSILYFLGLLQTLVLAFILLSESLEATTSVAYLANFFEFYMANMLYGMLAIIFFFMLYLIEKAMRNFSGGKKDAEE